MIFFQHPHLALPQSQVIDDANAASLSAPGQPPPKLPNATGTSNDVAGLRIGNNGVLQRGVLLVGEVVLHELREQLRLDEREHHRIIRQRRSASHAEVNRLTGGFPRMTSTNDSEKPIWAMAPRRLKLT